jgi:hypothetical protein
MFYQGKNLRIVSTATELEAADIFGLLQQVFPPPPAGNPTPKTRNHQEKQALDLSYQGNDLPTVLTETELEAADIFGLFQRVFRPADCRLVDGIDVLADWELDQDALITIAQTNSFLFSVRLFDCLFSCKSVPGLVYLLAVAFEQFSQYPGRQWQLMAMFVLEIGFKGVVCDTKTIEKLEDEITRLRSLRGRLTRTCRTIREENDREMASMREQLRQLRSQVARLEEELSMKEGEIERTISSKSEVRIHVFREMIELARRNGPRRYSDHLYYMAVGIRFRSASTYDFVREFLPVPSPVAIYHHFHVALTASLARLQKARSHHSLSFVANPTSRRTSGWGRHSHRRRFVFKCVCRDEEGVLGRYCSFVRFLFAATLSAR